VRGAVRAQRPEQAKETHECPKILKTAADLLARDRGERTSGDDRSAAMSRARRAERGEQSARR
jgi:hypothetical protein